MPLPSVLPLFPLPNVVLFPQVLLPLHIFEPRYRRMVKDVATGDDLVGMILYRSGGEQPAEDQPDVYSVGCAGRIIRKVDLADGRSNILLQGVREFVLREQLFERAYRRGLVTWRPATPSGLRLAEVLRRRLVDQIRGFLTSGGETELRILEDPTLTDEMLVNLFSFALDLPIPEKQSLLEVEGIVGRAERLTEILDFHVMERTFVAGKEPLKTRIQ